MMTFTGARVRHASAESRHPPPLAPRDRSPRNSPGLTRLIPGGEDRNGAAFEEGDGIGAEFVHETLDFRFRGNDEARRKDRGGETAGLRSALHGPLL
jgi:hypothetical protein